MKTNGNNRNVSPGNQREPGDVYMMLSTEGKIQAVSVNDLLYNRFEDFINDCAYYMGKDMIPPYGNSFFVQYRFNDPGKIPTENPNFHGYQPKLDAAIREQGLKPVNTLRLYPVMYCYEKNLNPMLPENSEQALKKSTDYQFYTLRHANYGLRTGEKTYTGIQTDRGVLLFDDTQQGEDLQQRYRNLFTANFFDPRLDVTFFRTMELIPTGAQRIKTNPDLDALYHPGLEPFIESPGSAYVNMKDVGIHTENERYDMSPTLANFAAISELDKGEIPSLPTDTYDISCLLYLSSPECKDPEIQDEYPNFFSYYDRFDPLGERFAAVGTETEKTQVMGEVRDLAGQILKENYPDIRQPSALNKAAKKRHDNTPVKNTGQQIRKLPDVAKKLTALPKKKGGISR